MFTNDKNDILSDILRSFHNDALVRCQESNDLNELASQHPGKSANQARMSKRAKPKKMPKLLALKKRDNS